MKTPRVMFCNPSPADGYEPSVTPDPDSAAVNLALCVADLESAIQHLTKAIKDDPALDETLDVYRERLRGIRPAIEAEMRHDG